MLPLDLTKPDKLTARAVTALSPEAQKKHYAHLIKRTSEKREAMSFGNALDIAAGRATRKSTA